MFAGPLRHDDVRTAYAEADVLVLASRAETYGMVVTEALAHGLPVIASAVGGVPRRSATARTAASRGCWSARTTRTALAGALRRWLEDPLRRRRLRRVGRAAPAHPADLVADHVAGGDVLEGVAMTDSRRDVATRVEPSHGRRSDRQLDERWLRLRILGGAVILVFLVWQLGHRAVRRRAARRQPWAVAGRAGRHRRRRLVLRRRWSLVAARLGAPVPVRTAYVAYYRSQLVNATLPGGVVGDVHRGVRHGLARACVWERGLGQVVQVALTVRCCSCSLHRRWPLVALAAGRGRVLVAARAVRRLRRPRRRWCCSRPARSPATC